DGQRVYVTNPNDDTLSVVRTSDFTEILPRVAVGDGPVGIAVSPDSSKVYTANFNSNTVSIVDATLLATVGTVDVSYQPNPIYQSRPCHVAVSPDGSKVYVAFNLTWYSVATIDVATRQVTQTLSQGIQYFKIAYI